MTNYNQTLVQFKLTQEEFQKIKELASSEKSVSIWVKKLVKSAIAGEKAPVHPEESEDEKLERFFGGSVPFSSIEEDTEQDKILKLVLGGER